MKHPDHVALLRAAQLPAGGTWADFGAGSGAFTLALRELVGPQAQIYAIDKDAERLGELQREHARRFGSTASLHVIASDFARSLDLPPLDGALMANSLHFFKDADAPSGLPLRSASGTRRPPPPNESTGTSSSTRLHAHTRPRRECVGSGEGREGVASRRLGKLSLLALIRGYLKPNGTLLLVEYNVDSGNMWVPYPLSFETWRKLAPQAGFSEPRLLATHPSRFLREFYSAVCYKGDNRKAI